jgi:threonine dehydratase
LQPTPLQHSRAFSDAAGCEVHLKLESVQPVRAFKVRGALNRLIRMSPERRAAGVITASAGNHGMGVAYAAAQFDVAATVYVPLAANQLKVEAIKRLGAHVVAAGETYHDAFVAASAEQQRTGATFVHAYNDPDVVAGQGTAAVEMAAQLQGFDTAVVPIGGGGLIGGISMYLKARQPSVRVVGVEPSGADSMLRSLEAGHIVTLDRVNTIADGLAASSPGTLSFDLAQRYVDRVVTVEDAEMLYAIRALFEWEHLLAEPAGSAALAALLYHPSEVGVGRRVVVVISGANVSEEVLLQALKSRRPG